MSRLVSSSHDQQVQVRNSHRVPAVPRSALVLLFGYTMFALVAATVRLPIPVNLPHLRGPLWIGIAAVAAGLSLLVIMRVDRRPVQLGVGWLLVTMTTVQAFVIGDLPGLLGLWLAVPPVALLAGQIRPRARRALVATHAITSAAWVGISVVIVTMAVIAMTTRRADVMMVTYQLMVTFDVTLLPWANFTATLSGIALGIATPWGLLRHYWVAIKLVISVSFLAYAFTFLHNSLVSAATDAERLATAGGVAPDLGALPIVVFGGFTFALANLVVAMVLSLYKPGGKTRRGKRMATVRRSGTRTPATFTGG